MKRIKTKDNSDRFIKKLDKVGIWEERIKDPIIYNLKNEKEINNEDNITSYGNQKINYSINRATDESFYLGRKMRSNIKKVKNNHIKIKIKNPTKSKETQETIKAGKRISLQMKKYAISIKDKSIDLFKKIGKMLIKSTKAIIKITKNLIATIAAGGWLAVIAIIVICLIGLLCSSIFGIFLSSEDKGDNSMTMNQVVLECNNDFYQKIETIQNTNYHNDFKMIGNMGSWKDILLIYTALESNGINKSDVITIDNNKKNLIKKIFWDMNLITYEIKDEYVIEQGVNIDEKPREVLKKILYVYIKNSNVNELKKKYSLSPIQINQINELNSQKYMGLWSGIIYGKSYGDYINWKQKDELWKNVRIGNTTASISDIGCLVTSISILIKHSGVDIPISNFNPGVFVENLNKNNGFDNRGNLIYAPITKIVPNFKYGGNINLRGMSKEEKYRKIKEYLDKGYFIAIEVKGATQNNQHWVAGINANNGIITIADPGANINNLFIGYEANKISQFNYFSAK